MREAARAGALQTAVCCLHRDQASARARAMRHLMTASETPKSKSTSCAVYQFYASGLFTTISLLVNCGQCPSLARFLFLRLQMSAVEMEMSLEAFLYWQIEMGPSSRLASQLSILKRSTGSASSCWIDTRSQSPRLC